MNVICQLTNLELSNIPAIIPAKNEAALIFSPSIKLFVTGEFSYTISMKIWQV